MKKKNLIWLLGGTATGKTTQSIQLHKHLNNFDSDSFKWKAKDYVKKFQVGRVKTTLTVYKNSIHIGRISFADCCGTDTLGKKEQIIKAYQLALRMKQKNIIIDGIMATGKWIDFLKVDKVNIFLFLLHFNNVDLNLKRLEQRRKIDLLPDNEKALSEHTSNNVIGRRRYFNSLFQKLSLENDIHLSELINADLEKEEITKIILKDLKH